MCSSMLLHKACSVCSTCSNARSQAPPGGRHQACPPKLLPKRRRAPAVGLLKLRMRSRFKRGWYLRGQGQLCQTSWERKGRGNAVCGCHISKNLYATKASVGNPEESLGKFLPARQRRDSQNDKEVSFAKEGSLTSVVY